MQLAFVTEAQLDEMVAFIARHNPAGQHHIGFLGDSEADIRNALAEFIHPLTENMLLASEADRIVGAFGVDFDPEIDRAWLYGPLVVDGEWQAVADALYAGVRDLIPPEIHEQDLFFDVRNLNGQAFAGRHAFPLYSENAILALEWNRHDPARHRQVEPPVILQEYQEACFDGLKALHTAAFPKAYLTARQMVSRIDGAHRLTFAVEDGRVLGYQFGKAESGSGYIDFLAVDASARGRGLGAALLASAIDWMFSFPNVDRIHLTVNADNLPALNLYGKFGFAAERVLRAFRKHTG